MKFNKITLINNLMLLATLFSTSTILSQGYPSGTDSKKIENIWAYNAGLGIDINNNTIKLKQLKNNIPGMEVAINGIPHFEAVFDPAVKKLKVWSDVAFVLKSAGLLTDLNSLGNETTVGYKNVKVPKKFIISQFTLPNGVVLKNVKAEIDDDNMYPVLLGTGFLKNYFKSVKFDGTKQTISLEKSKGTVGLTADKDYYVPERSILFRVKNNQDSVILANYYMDQTYAFDTTYVGKHGMGLFYNKRIMYRGTYLVVLDMRNIFDMSYTKKHFYFEADTMDLTKVLYNGSQENMRAMAFNRFMLDKNTQRTAFEKEIKEGANKKRKKEIEELIQAMSKEVINTRNIQIEKYPKDLLSHSMLMDKTPKLMDIGENPTDDQKKAQIDDYSKHYWDYVDFSEEGLVRLPGNPLQKKVDYYIANLTYPDADSAIKVVDKLVEMASKNKQNEKMMIWYLGKKYQTSKIMCYDKVYVSIAKKYYCTGRAFWVDSTLKDKICDEANKAAYTDCGVQLQNLMLQDKDNNFHELYAVNAPLTFVFFWDPTCSHCKKVIKILDSLYTTNKHKDWKIYAISSSNKQKEWLEYLDKNPNIKDWINVCHSSVYSPWPQNKIKYNIIANPTLFIVDKDKRIIGKRVPEDKMGEYIEKYIEVEYKESIDNWNNMKKEMLKKDTDGDGINNFDDKCPMEAGTKANGGCPDNDNDGVPNHLDGCKDFPGPKEKGGCPQTYNDVANTPAPKK